MIANDILMAEKMWNEIDSSALKENVKTLLGSKGYETYKSRLYILSEITGSSAYATEAWLNNSRKNVKIPFIKVCQIADYFQVDLYTLLEDNQTN